MKFLHRSIALIVCLSLLLACAACGTREPDPSTQPSTTAPAPTVLPTEPATDYLALYASAKEALASSADYGIHYTYDLSRQVSGETFTENRTGSALYQAMGTEAASILAEEKLTYGSYSANITQAYTSGSGYCLVGDNAFRSDMTPEDFCAQQVCIPLFDEALYADITAEAVEDGALLTFAGASAAESWLALPEEAALLECLGTATLSASGSLTAVTYHCVYAISTTTCTLDISVEIPTEPIELAWPELPSACPSVADLRIVLYLMRCVGDIYTAEAMSVTYSDTLYSQALGEIRIQNSSYYTYGSGDAFMASLNSQVSSTNYMGTTTNSQLITFRDGVYTTSVNDSEPNSYSNVTAEQMRVSCEDIILSALFMPDFISGAELTDTGDFLCIRFTGNDTYSDSICAGIYALYSMDLDAFAASYSTNSAAGYLTVNKYTGLPTAMGMSVERTHVIDKIAYSLTYQLDQAIDFTPATAYEGIAGEPLPEETADTATPVFYKVTASDGKVLYLFGTIHIGDGRTANLPQQLTDAFAASDALALEFNTRAFEQALLSDENLQNQISQLYYDVSKTIDKKLGTALYSQALPLMLATGQNNINAPYLRVAVWQNLIDNFFLAQGSRLTSGAGMETRLLDWAEAQSKPVYEIESGLAQLQMLTGFSQKLQILLLEETLSTGLLAYCAETDSLYEQWCLGDVTALTELLAEDTSGLSEDELALYNEYTKAMYTDRNAEMLTAATAYLESGETVFYAVGLAHLLGDGGLVAGLTAAGYTVELVSYE